MRLHGPAGEGETIAERIAADLRRQTVQAADGADRTENACRSRAEEFERRSHRNAKGSDNVDACDHRRQKIRPACWRAACLRQQHRSNARHRMRDRWLMDAIIFLGMDLICVDEGSMRRRQPLTRPTKH